MQAKKRGNTPPLTEKSKVQFHNLHFRKEGDDVILWKEGSDEFLSIPDIGKQTIQLLQEGLTLDKTEEKLSKSIGEEVDVRSFIETLLEMDFIASIDNVPIRGGEKREKVSLSWVRKEHLRWIVSRYLLFLVGIVYFFALITVIFRFSLIPSFSDFFWSDITSLVIIGNIAIGLFIVYLHELAHLFTARAFGIPGRISFSTRLLDLVMHTSITGMWAETRKKRLLVYLSGILFNLFTLSLTLLIIAYIPLPDTVARLLRVIMLTNILGILFEFQLYTRTDIYFVMMDVLHCKSLFADTMEYMRYLFVKILTIFRNRSAELQNPLSVLPHHEQKSVRMYVWVVLFGSSISILFFLFVGIPITIQTYERGIGSLMGGIEEGRVGSILDGITTLGIEIGFFTLFIKSFMASHHTLLYGIKTFFRSHKSRI